MVSEKIDPEKEIDKSKFLTKEVLKYPETLIASLVKKKNIYSEILNYATKGQANLKLSDEQADHISEIKIANQKIVEIIRDVRELEKM